jgi:Type II secretion system (T2SS), protein N
VKKALIAVVVLCLSALAMFFFAPASLLDTQVQKHSNGALALKNAEGSIWSGEGDFTLQLPGSEMTLLPKIKWRSSPLDLISGKIKGELMGTGGSFTGFFEMSQGEQILRDVKMKLPAASLAAAAVLASLSPVGDMDVSFPSAKFNPQGGTGNGTLVWNNASVQLPNTAQRLSLGNVQADITLEGAATRFVLRNQGGQAALSGGGVMQRGSPLAIDIALAPNETAPIDVRVAIAQLGKADASGAYRLQK